MKMRFLGSTGIWVSELCLGTANFGAAGEYIYKNTSMPGYSFGMSYLRTSHERSKIKDAAFTKSGR